MTTHLLTYICTMTGGLPNKKETFTQLLDFFPLVELPVLLGETTHLTFSEHNPPLPEYLAHLWLERTDLAIDEELTEYIPCFHFQLPDNKIGLVYWEAGLLYYDYHLIVFEKDGTRLDEKVIAGLRSKDQVIYRTIAHLEEDFSIHTMAASHRDQEDISPENTSSQSYRILPEGRIMPS